MDVLVRMFFLDGKTELRPLKRVRFVRAQDFEGATLDRYWEQLETEADLYVVFTDKLKGLQLYRGEFVDVRQERGRDNNHR